MDDWEYDDCPKCGELAKYFVCWSCGGEGGEYPYEYAPLEYSPDEFDSCDICSGRGHYWVCSHCSTSEATATT